MNAVGYIFEGGSGLALTPKAEKLARYLMARPNRILTRSDMAAGCNFEGNGRSCDTFVSEIRRALGSIERIVSRHGQGYGWIGDPVPLVAVVKECERPAKDPLMKYAVMTQAEVAKRLGISSQAVKKIERDAIAKIKKNPEIKKIWRELQAHFKRMQYDPFHEIWLFDVAKKSPE